MEAEKKGVESRSWREKEERNEERRTAARERSLPRFGSFFFLEGNQKDCKIMSEVPASQSNPRKKIVLFLPQGPGGKTKQNPAVSHPQKKIKRGKKIVSGGIRTHALADTILSRAS